MTRARVAWLDFADGAHVVNLHLGADELDLWVWVDPRGHRLRTHLERHGGFECGPALPAGPRVQAPDGGFFPPAAGAGVSEYWLETVRAMWFASYPSRSNSIRAFRSESSAAAFRAYHLAQTRSCLLKRASSCGSYAYSTHDPRWLSQLRRQDDVPALAADFASRYWRGCSTHTSLATAAGSWALEEILFVGRIDIYEPCLPLV
jgi:hypothetical protein